MNSQARSPASNAPVSTFAEKGWGESGVPVFSNPVWLAGFSQHRAATQIHDDLWAVACVIDDGYSRLGIVALDAIGFFHDDLTNIGIEMVSRNILVGDDSIVEVRLASPSAETLLALHCRDSAPAPDRGAAIGVIRDAESHRAVVDASVVATWGAIALDGGSARYVQEARRVNSSSDGIVALCGLPLEVPLSASIIAEHYFELSGPIVSVPPSRIGTFAVTLALRSATRRGPDIHGHVTAVDGKPIATGRVRVVALGVEAAVRDGTFLLPNLPAGTWLLETQSIGIEPESTLVTVTHESRPSVTVTMTHRTQMLDAVTVIGVLDRNTRVLADVLRRRNHYGGTFFLPGSDAMRMAAVTSDLLKEARGFRWKDPAELRSRLAADCVALFVDGEREPQGLEVLDDVAPLSEVLAVETYPRISLAPIQFRSNFGVSNPRSPHVRSPACAVVVVWTRGRRW